MFDFNINKFLLMDFDGFELLYDGDCVVQRPWDGLGHEAALLKLVEIGR